MPDAPLIVVEDDPFLRVLQVVLDPTPVERYAAFADFFAHEADFGDYCARVRATVPGLFPARVQMVETQDELRARARRAHAAWRSRRSRSDARSLPPRRN